MFNEGASRNRKGKLALTPMEVSKIKAPSSHRHHNEVKRRFKAARLPEKCNLDDYDYSFDNGLHKTRINQLRELGWIDQLFNLMLMGPSGVGKSFLTAGLCADAVKNGYKAYFRTMEEILNMLKMKRLYPHSISRLQKAAESQSHRN